MSYGHRAGENDGQEPTLKRTACSFCSLLTILPIFKFKFHAKQMLGSESLFKLPIPLSSAALVNESFFFSIVTHLFT